MTPIHISSSININEFAKLSITEDLNSREIIQQSKFLGVKLFFTKSSNDVKAIVEVDTHINGVLKHIIKKGKGKNHYEAYDNALNKVVKKYSRISKVYKVKNVASAA